MLSLSQPLNTGNTAPKPHYPLFASLEGSRAVVVGAGAVAARKIDSLLSCGADVTVIAPHACDEIAHLAESGCISYLAREYEKGDLDGALLCIAATSDRKVNEAVSADAHAKPILVNVVDVPELCNFIVPSTLKDTRIRDPITPPLPTLCFSVPLCQALVHPWPQKTISDHRCSYLSTAQL